MEIAELDKEFNQRVQEKQNWYNGGYARDVQSNLTPPAVFGFIEEQKTAQQEAAETRGFGTAMLNGVKGSVRGLLGAAKALVDSNIAEHEREDPNYRPYGDFSGTLQTGIDYLQREEVKADSAAGQLVYDLTEGAVQYAMQAAVTAATGGTAGAVYMGANIAGDQYLELRKEGVDAERAALAGLMNAPFQAALEKIGMGKIMAKLPAGSGLKKKLGEVLKASLEEGITEGLQELPEQFTNIWAKDKNATAGSMAAKWGENWEQNVKEAGYSALLGGILGGSAKGLHIIANSVGRKVGEKVTEVKKEQLVADAERVAKSGVNPEYAAALIDANSQGETVTVQAADLNAFKQQTNGAKLMETLGVTEEQIEQATENGQDIDISRGRFTAAMVEHKGLYEATKDSMIFDIDGDLSTNAAENFKTLKADTKVSDEQMQQLDLEVKNVVDSAIAAGMNKAHAENLQLMLESRAIIASPENPAAWLQKNKLRFENGGKKPLKSGWFSQSGKLNTDKFFTTQITGNELGSYRDLKDLRSKAINWYRTNLQGQKVKNSVLGEIRIGKGFSENDVGLTGSGRRKMSSTSAKAEKLLAVRYLKEIIEGGNFVTEAAAHKEKHSGENFYYIHSLLNVNGENRYVVVTVRELNNKELVYYNHNVFTENEYKKTEDALRPSDSAISNAGQYPKQQSSFKDSVTQKADVYKSQTIINGTLKDKGMISPMENGDYIITLFKDADASTVIHETGHYFVDTMINEAIADPSNTRLVKDAKILLEYGGMTLEQWKSSSLEEKRAAHEKLAEGFETYIMEGKAPSAGLRKAFQRFAKWLTAIYSKIARNENAADINDDVRGVFDRMLASQEEIEMQAKLNGMFNELPSELTNKLPPEAKNALLDKISKAKDKAVDILTREMMKNFNAERRAAKEAYIKEITPKAEEFIHRDKVNQGRDLVAYHFGGEKEKNNPYFKDENGKAHANKPIKVHRDANPSIIARKYRHAIGSVLPNYNDVLQDTRAAINDRLNPIIEDLKNSIVEYNESLRDAWAQGGAEGYWTLEGKSIDPTIIKDYVKANGGKYDDNVRAKLERDGYVFHPADEEVSGDNWYRNYVEENGKKKLSNKELERIARDIYSGNDYYKYDPEAKMYEGNPEYEAEIQNKKAELDELYRLKEKLEKSPEGVDLVQMSKRSALSDEQRVLFETIAEEVGYSSGDEMAQDILNKPSERQMVRNFINEAVQARFPDIYAERALTEEKAREALYNDESGELIALEQQLIQGYIEEAAGIGTNRQERQQRAKVMAQKVKVYAENELRGMTMRDITKGNGRKFLMAERRAAATAQKALADGDLNTANYAKQQQLINHELYRRSLEIRGKMKNAKRLISKMANMKKENFGTQQHFNQMGALLERLGIKRKGYDKNSNTQSLQEYDVEMKGKYGEIVDIPEFVMNPLSDLSNPDALTLEQFEDVVNAIKNLLAIARQDTKMEKINSGASFDSTKAELMAELEKNHGINYEPAIGTPQRSKREKFKDWGKAHWQGNRNADNFYLSLDNWTEGFFTKNFYKPLNRSADDEANMRMELQAAYEAAYKKWVPTKQARQEAGAKRYYEELGGSATKDELIQMACNLGNEGNAQRLCESAPEAAQNSELWVKESALVSREDAAKMTRQNIIEFLSKNLTAADIEYAQAKIDACNKLWPRLREVNLRTKGFAPKEVQATPVVFKLADGTSVTMRGGYFPLVRDTQMGSAPAGQNRIAGTDETFTSGMNTMTTASGSSKERTRAKYPVSLVAGCEIRNINDTIHDIAFRETILDLRKLLNDEEIFRKMKSRLGESNLKLLKENVEICANPNAYNGKVVNAEKDVDQILNWLRTMTVNASILGNIKTSFQNLGNIFLYARSVEGFGYADVLVAMKNAIPNHAEIHKLCMEKSVFMRERMIVPEYSLREINGRGDLTEYQKKTLKWGAYMLSATDMATAKPVWAQAYAKKLNEGKSEAEAIEFADTVIRRTLGSSRIYDVASVRRGSDKFKLLTMFQGFFSTQFNQWDREIHLVSKLWGEGNKKQAIFRASAFLTGKWLAVCLANIYLALENPFEEDEDGYMKLTKELVSYPLSMGGPVAQAANVIVQNAIGMRNYGYRFTPIQSTVDSGFTIVGLLHRIGSEQEKEGDKKELTERTIKLAANAYGIPSSPINIFANLWDDFVADEMDFEIQDLIKRRPRSERKHEQELAAKK